MYIIILLYKLLSFRIQNYSLKIFSNGDFKKYSYKSKVELVKTLDKHDYVKCYSYIVLISLNLYETTKDEKYLASAYKYMKLLDTMKPNSLIYFTTKGFIIFIKLGQFLMNNDEFQKALDCFELALKRNKNDELALLGRVYNIINQ